MIKSMTGYGRASGASESYSVTVELKSVNHRFFEFTAKVPRIFSFLDEKIKACINRQAQRGKIECLVQIEPFEIDDTTVTLNKAVLEGYLSIFKELEKTKGIKNDLTASSLICAQDIFTVKKNEIDEQAVTDIVLEVVEKALESFIQMRLTEGEKLRDDIAQRIKTIFSDLKIIESGTSEIANEYYEKMLARLNELLSGVDIDEQRVLTEAAIFADKTAIDEETVRLRSHLSQLADLLNESEPIGRKMDFLVQEINREVNTIGSKCQNMEITKAVIDIKSEIEKIREQIQNIE